MSPATSGLTDLPARSGWDFGDFPYGLEPLMLPDPLRQGQRGGPPGRDFDADSAELLRELGALPPCRRDAPPLVDADHSRQVFWFRWITGHQTTFAVWQCLARTLNDALAEPDRHQHVEVMSQLVGAYTAMLLYTGSCPTDLYHEVIRPSMYLQHRSFSGVWAPDFGPVRRLLRGRKFPWSDTPQGEELARQVRAYHEVHMGVAARLVPDGRSLLQETAAQTRLSHLGTRAVVYDNYFLTLRIPVDNVAVIRQLVRRLKAIALDVTENGLYPGRDADAPGLPTELRTPSVVARERAFTDTVTGLAALVTGAA
ncbi:hypothetical protein [Kutzneria buriramensis]|uniref:L-tyrosine 3-hydroxylase n=1 Tax=Kutzneria buriramensis TaxID=1045776 RepID=A0A3E0G4Z8_9PSEU|nr:hypothetical protein [Kutzneria buriramensis]REH17872.1 hypothetical protein BCF44_14212 [Kutzneria buriramensis]